MAHRIRSSEIAIFCAYVLFGFAWLMLRSVRDPLVEWESVVLLYPEIRTVLAVVDVASLVGFFAIVVGGLPILFAALTRAVITRRKDVLALFALPVLLTAVCVLATILVIGGHLGRGGTPADAAIQLGYFGLGLVSLIGSTAGVAVAVAQSEIGERFVRFALVPAVVVTAAIGAGLIATLVLDALISIDAPQLLAPWLLWAIVLLMAASTGLAAIALRRGLVARSVA